MRHYSPTQLGFTLIEMIVSLAVFSIVIMMSVGALLMLVATNGQLQNEQSVMTNLSFAIDSMTREIRTGTRYFCESRPNDSAGPYKMFNDDTDLDAVLGDETLDCEEGKADADHPLQGVAFEESGDSITGVDMKRILYFYDADEQKLFRRVGDGPAQSIVSSGIRITDAEFFVTGSDSLDGGSNNHIQPTVTIYVKATEDRDGVVDPKEYEIQTMVTQRTLDL